MYNIRRAQQEDCPAMLKLIRELALFEKAPEQVTVSLSHFEESGFGEKPIWWAFVAEDHHKIVGMALYYIRYSTWKGQRMYLEDIIITEAYRGKGLGSLMMERLFVEAKEKGFNGMIWQVLDWNESAIHFYQKYNPKFDAEWLNVSVDF
ncbi:MAG: GNAT family N-acetyltransferase [Phycisphaerales bacterium]|nr:GNAT family N-acetyltransferase [Phycisphaerales bacterium]